MRSTTSFKRGDVVLLIFAFTDQSGAKKRPAVVLSTDAYNRRRNDLIVAPITSNITTGQPDDTILSEWSKAGLVKPGLVKGILGTAEKHLIIRKLGILSEYDFQRAEIALARALGFQVISNEKLG
jgi:mRNA interferase MazF